MNVSSQEIADQIPRDCETFLDLIGKVGGRGKYQYILTLIFMLSWYVTGVLLLSTSFIFLNPEFDCAAFGLLTNDCYDFVCSLPANQWPNFVTEEANSFKSLANSFDHYLCDDEFFLNLYASCTYFGGLLGYMFVTFLSDNYGRRKITIIAWAICTLGLLLLVLAQNMQMAAAALFLCGFGSDSVLCVTTSVMVECYEDNLRQKHCTIIQMAFTGGALLITLFFWLWQDWQPAVLYGLLIPSAITLFLIIWFVRQTPMYLIKSGPQHALKILNEIGEINQKKCDCLKLKDIENVMAHQQTVTYDKMSTPLDVFRFDSLRATTIAQGIISMATYVVYYGPSLIIAQIGFNIYISETVLNVADILTYYPLMLMVDKIKRKKTCIILFSIATFISGLLIFITKPDNCDNCQVVYIQLGLVFIFRFCIAMEFTLMLVYQSEVYPTRVRNIAAGVLGVFGTVTSTLSPIIMGLFTRANINHFILFTCLGLIAVGSYTIGPETHMKLCPQEIQEIQFQKRNRSIQKSLLNQKKQH